MIQHKWPPNQVLDGGLFAWPRKVNVICKLQFFMIRYLLYIQIHVYSFVQYHFRCNTEWMR